MLFVSLLAFASFQTAAVPPTALTVTVQALPARFKQNPVVSVKFNGKGSVSSCVTAVSSGSPGIDKVACSQLVGNYTVDPVNGAAPAPADVVVAFETEAPKK